MAEIINAFGRKSTDPIPAAPAEPEIVVNQYALALAEYALKEIKAGKVTRLAIIGVSDGAPMTAMAGRASASIVDLALLSVAADTLKELIRETVEGYSRGEAIAAPAPESEPT